MLILYNLATRAYYLLIRVASIFNTKAKKLYAGQKKALGDIEEFFIQHQGKRVIWIHTASLGEFEQGRPVIEAIKENYPSTLILLTFFSPSGYEVRNNYEKADLVTYLPFDTSSNASMLVRIVNPSLVIFVKYEFWHHYIKAVAKAAVPLLSISTIFKPNQPFFRWYGGLHRSMLRGFDHFFVQNDQSFELLEQLGIKKATRSGDTRYDRVNTITDTIPDLPLVASFLKEHPSIIIGSSWPSDMKLIKDGLTKIPVEMKIIIAPHNIDDNNILEIETSFKSTVRYSQLSDENGQGNAKVLIVDNIGMLSQLYGYGTLAYVGGGARGALHNTLEPATWGILVLFAEHENNKKFQEAIDLVANGGAFEVSDSNEFEEQLLKLIRDKEMLNKTGQAARDQVVQNAGATAIIMEYIKPILDA